jgi:hypothetical protein
VSYKLSGINPLAYMGVEPNSPAQTVVFDFAPTVNDTNFNLGTLWLDTATQVPWELVSLANGTAVWIQLGASSITFPITVAQGGTGTTSFTPYAVLTGGTTSTGPIQSVASVGTSGEVLTSNGPGALPTFQAAGASGAVTSFITDPATGTATPASGVITVAGASGNTVSASGSTITITGSSSGASNFVFSSFFEAPGGSGNPTWGGIYGVGFRTDNNLTTQTSMPIAGTVSKLYANIGDNTLGANLPIYVNKNGSHTILTVTIPSGTTGVFTDLVDSFTIAIGDTLQLEFDIPSTTGSATGVVSALFTS